MSELQSNPDTLVVLDNLYQGNLTVEQAMDNLAIKPHSFKGLKKARYIKMRMRLPNESRKLNLFFKMLFMFPIPIVLVKPFLKKGLNKVNPHVKDHPGSSTELDFEEIYGMLRHAKKTKIDIETEDANITIKVR